MPMPTASIIKQSISQVKLKGSCFHISKIMIRVIHQKKKSFHLMQLFFFGKNYLFENMASVMVQMVKNLPAVQETWVPSWVREIPWRREWLPTPVLPRESPWTEGPGKLQSTGFQSCTRLSDKHFSFLRFPPRAI